MRVLIGATLSATFCISLFAQGNRAAVIGTVTDPGGGAIPSCAVVLTHLETDQPLETASNQSGALPVSFARRRHVSPQRDLSRFKTYQRDHIELQVAQNATLDVRMEVGGVSEKLEVVADSPLTELDTNTVGQVIGSREIQDMPLNGRNPLELMTLSTGVNLLAEAFLDMRNFNLTSVSISGGQGGANSMTLDGGSITLPQNNEYAVAPNVDAVQEFKVQSHPFSAEYGKTSGGAITMVTKSGTNQFHGTLFEFLRNDDMDANGWTNDRLRLAKPALHYNQSLGGTIGGPVLLPKYNGKNRTFFFFNYEGIRYESTLFESVRVPTAKERQGDFSATYIRNTTTGQNIVVPIYDPATTQPNPNGNGFVRSLFPGSIIPQSRFDPVAIKALQYLPLPQQVGDSATAANNYAINSPTPTNNNQYTVRIDHEITQNEKLFGRFTYNNSVNVGNPAYFSPSDIGDPDYSGQHRLNYNALLGLTSTLSPTLLSEIRLSFTRQHLVSEPAGYLQNAPEKLGLPATVPDYLFPRFNISNVTNMGGSNGQLALRGQICRNSPTRSPRFSTVTN